MPPVQSRAPIRPLRRVNAGVYRTRDSKVEICRHQGDSQPQRWFAYEVEQVEEPHPRSSGGLPDNNGAAPINDGEGHTSLAEVVDFLEARRV